MSAETTEIETPAEPDLAPGATVGEYRVDGKLGQGAFGTVYKAVHPVIGKVVAIKVLARRFSVDPEMVSRFIAEARAVNQIRHRHIIDIFSFDALADGRRYYVMEYLDGEPLDALIERQGRLAMADALPILRGIAKALDAAHAKGIAHRDLKAENVFLGVDADGGVFPKLLDFGIAKLLAPEDGLKHKTRTGAPIGTPYYMSPEQCRGKDVDHRTDLYAFGVLAYVMLTGAYPFDADDYMSILMKQITEQPAPPSTLVGELPPQVDDVILWLMAKDPAARPDNLNSAVRALEDAAAGAGLAIASPTSVWEAHTPPPSMKYQTRPPTTGTQVGTKPLDVVVAPARRRSRVLMVAALVIAAAVVVVVTRGGEDTPVPAPVAQPVPVPVPMPSRPTVRDESALPQTVIVTVAGAPEGTEVLAGGMTVGAAPGPVQLPRDTSPLVLTFKADGHVMTSKEVVPDRDQTLTVTLKKRSGGAGRRSTKDDILDPFGGKR